VQEFEGELPDEIQEIATFESGQWTGRVTLGETGGISLLVHKGQLNGFKNDYPVCFSNPGQVCLNSVRIPIRLLHSQQHEGPKLTETAVGQNVDARPRVLRWDFGHLHCAIVALEIGRARKQWTLWFCPEFDLCHTDPATASVRPLHQFRPFRRASQS
jgi:hypothetical protein